MIFQNQLIKSHTSHLIKILITNVLKLYVLCNDWLFTTESLSVQQCH